MKINIQLVLILVGFILFSCNQMPVYMPKPKTYPRLIFPAKNYSGFLTGNNPYYFEIPQYAKMEKDSTGVYTKEAFWYNLNFKPYNATLHLTYYPFTNNVLLDSLIHDTRKLVYKHVQRAEEIEEININNFNETIHGYIFDIKGNTASNLNFFITDSSKNFLRGALYFNKQTDQDSIAPVYHFLKADIYQLIKTFKWVK